MKIKLKNNRLPPALKANFKHWLNKDYWGIMYTPEGSTESSICAVNTLKTLNFWAEKSGLNGKRKREDVLSLWSAYREGEIDKEDRIDFPRRLTQKMILKHFEGTETVYYTNRHNAVVHNILLDWDDKERKHLDTEAAARWTDKKLFQGISYIEPSTSGKGTHQYLFVEVKGIDVAQRKKTFKRVIILLRKFAKKKGFRCADDLDWVKGQAPEVELRRSSHKLYEKKPWYPHYVKGGILAKLPRLGTTEEQERFCGRKILPWEGLLKVIARLEKEVGDTPEVLQRVEAKEERLSVCVDKPINNPIITSKTKDLQSDPDAFNRSLQCYKGLWLELGRKPTKEELDARFHSQGLNRRPNTHRGRESRHQWLAAKYIFNPKRFQSRQEALLSLVDTLVPQTLRDAALSRRTLHSIDLAVGLYVFELNAMKDYVDPDHRYSCGRKAIIDAFTALHDAAVIDRKCDPNKAIAIRDLLVASGLVQFLDEKYIPASVSKRGKGVSKKYGLGPAHPRYDEFMKILDKNPVVKVGVKSSSTTEEVMWDGLSDVELELTTTDPAILSEIKALVDETISEHKEKENAHVCTE